MAASFVKTRGTRFVLDERDFPIAGVNCYFLAYCSEASRRDAMNAAKRLGSNTIRTWAFLDVASAEPGQVAFQYLENGVIQQNGGPNGLERLDATIAAAEEMDLKLILPLVNYWPDFGGMPM